MAKRRGIDVRVDAYAAQGAARRMCETEGLRVVFDLDDKTPPYTDRGTVHIAPPLPGMSQASLNNWWGKLIHETKHNSERGRDGAAVLKNKFPKKEDRESLHFNMLSLFEDTTIDQVGVGEYRGQDESASIYSSRVFEQNINNPKMKQLLWENPALDEQSILAGTAMLTDAFARQQFQPDMAGRYHEVLDNSRLHPEIRKRFEQTVEEGWADELLEMVDEDPEKLHEWYERWVEAVHELPPPPPQGGGSGGEGEGDSSDNQQSGDGSGSSKDGANSGAKGRPGDDDSQDAGGGGGTDDSDDPGDENQPESGESDGDGQDDDGEGQSDAQPDSGDEQSMAPAGDGDGDSGEGDEPLSELASTIFEKWERDDHKPLKVSEKRGRGNQEIGYHESYSGRYAPTPAERVVVVDYPRGQILDAAGYPSTQARFDDFQYSKTARAQRYKRYKCPEQTNDMLAQKVKRHIQSETRTRVDRNKKKGKLDQRKLFKLGVKGASEDWRNRVFWQRDQKLSVKETAVSLLADYSGSMGGSKVVCAMAAMARLIEVCESLNIDHEVAGFTTVGDWYSGAPLHMIMKPFGRKVGKNQIIEGMEEMCHHMDQNLDGENVLVAYNRIKAHPTAKRRVLIVLSDGQPAGGGGDIQMYTRDVTRAIEEEGIVELHGIGIESNAVIDYYKSHSVIHDDSELEDALLTVLKNNVIRIK